MKAKADYKSVEKELNKLIERRTSQIMKAEAELQEEKDKLNKAQENKQKMLESGTKEEYLSACSKVKSYEDSMEFLDAKFKAIKQNNKISVEDLKRIYGDITKEQHSITRAGLKEIREKAEELNRLCEAVFEEQNRGSDLYRNALDVFKEDASEGEFNALRAGVPYLVENKFSCRYGINFVAQLRIETDNLLKSINRPAINAYIEER